MSAHTMPVSEVQPSQTIPSEIPLLMTCKPPDIALKINQEYVRRAQSWICWPTDELPEELSDKLHEIFQIPLVN